MQNPCKTSVTLHLNRMGPHKNTGRCCFIYWGMRTAFCLCEWTDHTQSCTVRPLRARRLCPSLCPSFNAVCPRARDIRLCSLTHRTANSRCALPRAVHSCAQISKMAIEPATMKVTELKDELTKRGALDDLLQFPWVRMISNLSHRFPCMYAPPSLCSRPLSSGLSCPLHQFLA